MDLIPSRPTDVQRTLGAQLADDLRAISATGRTGGGSAFWADICDSLAQLAATEDPLFFMRWEPIRQTMVHGSTAAIIGDWWLLRRSPEWRQVWAPAIRHPQFGHPPPFPPMVSTNAMTVEHATHLFHFKAATGTRLWDSPCILEFGGGYGSMCRLTHALGFTGQYVIFDLPHVLALQRYYLGLHGIRAGTDETCPVRLCSDLHEVASILGAQPGHDAAMISTWALSEMPLVLRDQIEPFLRDQRVGKALLAYQAAFEGCDNRAWFTGLAERSRDHMSWIHRPVGRNHAEIPIAQASDCYLMGIRPRP